MSRHLAVIVLAAVVLPGCSGAERGRGLRPHYDDPAQQGPAVGIGIESQDIVRVTDEMAKDILASKAVAGRDRPPRVVIDSAYFRNESASIINKNLLTDRLRTELNRAAAGEIVFLARHHTEMVEDERLLEEAEEVTPGTKGKTRKRLGYDYRLGGRIASLDAVDAKTGVTSRYHQITFELIERGTTVIAWTKVYEFTKVAQDDVIYR